MTRTLEISPELEAQIQRAAAHLQTDEATFIVQAITEKALRVFDETLFESLLRSDAVQALDYLIQITPDKRANEAIGPSPSNDVALSYEDDSV